MGESSSPAFLRRWTSIAQKNKMPIVVDVSPSRFPFTSLNAEEKDHPADVSRRSAVHF
jgi:hypothetical protein